MSSIQPSTTIEAALASFDRNSIQPYIAEGERERAEIQSRFPVTSWPSMSLEAYALGHEKSKESYCYLMERATSRLGSIRGGSARKLLIYRKNDGGWFYDPEYGNERAAWDIVRQAFLKAFDLARTGDWKAIDELAPLRSGPALRVKTLHVYFPDEVLPIASRDHIAHFLRRLGRREAEDRQMGSVEMNRVLLSALRSFPSFHGWSTNEMERFLYWWSDPRERRRIVKIAPGENARFWDDCLKGGYICVGWDAVGDLRDFDSKESFRTRFFQKHPYHGNASTSSRKANELWTLTELEPGDMVLANKGTEEALALGEVVEPGYEWMEEREEFKHIVRVRWDTSYAQKIPKQKTWATTTVAPVSQALYQALTKQGPVVGSILPIEGDGEFDEIADALERKGQAILYGPPGTGKTYLARRFAVYWLNQKAGKTDAASVFADEKLFEQRERQLSTVQISRRVWWIVANPKEWSWDRLFKEKKVSYRYGRLQRNYPLVQPGDLVIGYQGGTDKRIVALARVTRGFAAAGDEKPHIELEPLAMVNEGLEYKKLIEDPVMGKSEPIRFRNQGTLFALTADESNYILGYLAENQPALQQYLEEPGGIGPLTRLTFHPSYSYEDFMEGFRPAENSTGSITLRLEDGVFKRICREAQAQQDKTFLVLIDEINRANVAKVFGEIITLIENDKRGLTITLPQSKESFCVPKNVYLLATMNTADRSIKLLDAALRRRFAFIELMPKLDLLADAKIGVLSLDGFLAGLNARIAAHIGREKQIGHAVLLDQGQPVTDQGEFVRRFRQEILPLLQEYCYEDYSALAKYLGPKLVKEQEHTLDQDLLSDADALLALLEDEFSSGSGGAAQGAGA